MTGKPQGFQPMPPFAPCFHGTATVNDKGQVVIPAEARKALGIESGDKLLAFAMGGSLMLSPVSEMEKFAAMLAGRLDGLRTALDAAGGESTAMLAATPMQLRAALEAVQPARAKKSRPKGKG